MSADLEGFPLPEDREELINMLRHGSAARQRPAAPKRKRQIGAADVTPFVNPGLNHNDLRLIARMARIAEKGGSSTLMRCLGIAAREPEEITATIERFSEETPPDQFVLDSLAVAQLALTSGVEQRLEPSSSARQELMNSYPRYAQLLAANRADPTDRSVQYYAMGRIAGMVASAYGDSPVQ